MGSRVIAVVMLPGEGSLATSPYVDLANCPVEDASMGIACAKLDGQESHATLLSALEMDLLATTTGHAMMASVTATRIGTVDLVTRRNVPVIDLAECVPITVNASRGYANVLEITEVWRVVCTVAVMGVCMAATAPMVGFAYAPPALWAHAARLLLARGDVLLEATVSPMVLACVTLGLKASTVGEFHVQEIPSLRVRGTGPAINPSASVYASPDGAGTVVTN